MDDHLYIFVIGAALCVSYYILGYLFALFFEKPLPKFTWRSAYSLALIFGGSILVYLVVQWSPDEEFGNRIQHAFGGGFLGLLTCYLAVRDTKLSLNRFQFFALAFLVVTALGVANELFEYILQNYFHFVISETVNDTWLDLWSNTVGALLGAACFVSLIQKK